MGFEEQYNEKIFGIFQRLHGRNFEGTGIGLAIAKKIIENHNGFISAESKLGEGSTFSIILPLRQKQQMLA
jgi:two-component system CheB/CheR fusion protein